MRDLARARRRAVVVLCERRAGRPAATSGSRRFPALDATWLARRDYRSSRGRATATGSMRSDAIRRRSSARTTIRSSAPTAGAASAILRQRFLDEIGQYLPADGPRARHRLRLRAVLALLRGGAPRRSVRGPRPEPAAHRDGARAAAQRLGLDNVRVRGRRRARLPGDREFAAAYMLDIVHHVPPEAVRPLLDQLAKCAAAGRPPRRSRTWTRARPEALVHLGARQGDGPARARALLARRRARRR